MRKGRGDSVSLVLDLRGRGRRGRLRGLGLKLLRRGPSGLSRSWKENLSTATLWLLRFK